MKIMMMGTGPFAIPTFQALCQDENLDVIGLVTRPAVATRRKKSSHRNPMKEAAEQLGVAVHAPESINDSEVITWLNGLGCDLFVVCDYGQILSDQALSAARLGGINLHGSLLPKYRGSAPIQWALYHGEAKTGVSVIQMTPGLDAGPILATRETTIEPRDDAITIEERLSKLGVEAILETIKLFGDEKPRTDLGKKQDESQTTKAPRLKKQNGLIRWERNAVQIANQVRAFTPWPGSFSFLPLQNGKLIRVVIHEIEIVSPEENEGLENSTPGELLKADDSNIWIATGDGIVNLVQLQLAGKRVMTNTEVLRGYNFKIGETLQASEGP